MPRTINSAAPTAANVKRHQDQNGSARSFSNCPNRQDEEQQGVEDRENGQRADDAPTSAPPQHYARDGEDGQDGFCPSERKEVVQTDLTWQSRGSSSTHATG